MTRLPEACLEGVAQPGCRPPEIAYDAGPSAREADWSGRAYRDNILAIPDGTVLACATGSSLSENLFF